MFPIMISIERFFTFFILLITRVIKVLPVSRVLRCHRKPASKFETLKLQLPEGTDVFRIERVRSISDKPTIIETITLAAEPFVDLEKEGNRDLPNTLYELYEKKFGITIHSADEQLRAINASKHDAKLLDLEVGAPLLEIQRVAMTLNKTPVELRVSRCNTRQHHYQNSIF